jgi:hypothetical protein
MEDRNYNLPICKDMILSWSQIVREDMKKMSATFLLHGKCCQLVLG